MKKSELKQLIREVITEVIQSQPQRHWDADEFEVEVNGKRYFVNADFNWQQKAVGHRPMPGDGHGRDQMAEVPVSIKDIEATDEDGNGVLDQKMLNDIGEIVIDRFADSEQGMRNPSWAK